MEVWLKGVRDERQKAKPQGLSAEGGSKNFLKIALFRQVLA